MNLFALNHINHKKRQEVRNESFGDKPSAKARRDALNQELPGNAQKYFVSPGPDHHRSIQ